MDEIEAAGYYAMLYCSKDFLDSYLYPAQLTAYDKWIAQYASKCTCKHPYGIWQYTGTGRVNGIVGDVDRDIAYKDYPSIIAKMNKQQNPQKFKLPYTVIVSNGNVQELSKRGYFAFTSESKCCVGKFATQAEAEITQKDLTAKGYSCHVGRW